MKTSAQPNIYAMLFPPYSRLVSSELEVLLSTGVCRLSFTVTGIGTSCTMHHICGVSTFCTGVTSTSSSSFEQEQRLLAANDKMPHNKRNLIAIQINILYNYIANLPATSLMVTGSVCFIIRY